MTTPAPEVAEAAATIDPTALALLSIFGGVAITVIGGFIGAWIQGRREHRKWLRDQRYEAFVRLLVLMRGIVSTGKSLNRLIEEVNEAAAKGEQPKASTVAALNGLQKKVDETFERFGEVAAPMRLLGSSNVDSTLDAHVPLLIDDDETKAQEAEKAIVAAMRKAVGITD